MYVDCNLCLVKVCVKYSMYIACDTILQTMSRLTASVTYKWTTLQPSNNNIYSLHVSINDREVTMRISASITAIFTIKQNPIYLTLTVYRLQANARDTFKYTWNERYIPVLQLLQLQQNVFVLTIYISQLRTSASVLLNFRRVGNSSKLIVLFCGCINKVVLFTSGAAAFFLYTVCRRMGQSEWIHGGHEKWELKM